MIIDANLDNFLNPSLHSNVFYYQGLSIVVKKILDPLPMTISSFMDDSLNKTHISKVRRQMNFVFLFLGSD